MMPLLTIRKGAPLAGSVTVPGDKSITHRSVIFGAMAEGVSRVHGYLASEDCLATIGAFRRMGVDIVEDEELVIQSPGWKAFSEPDDVIDCGNSGTTARLLTGLLSGLPFFSALTGDASLRRRPMRRVVEPLSRMGAKIVGRDGANRLPLGIVGQPLSAVDYASPVASAQVKTALILAGVTAQGTTRITEPAVSRDHTERMLPAFGAPLSVHNGTVEIRGGASLTPADITVPGDISSAAFLIVAATLVPGSAITIRNVGINPTRTGILDLLNLMGADIRLDNYRETAGEPVADLVVRSARLTGIRAGAEFAPRTIDEYPVLFVAAAAAEGVSQFTGLGELRVKESDRIAAMARELTKAGVTVEELPDGLVVHGGQPVHGVHAEAYGDHRIAMSMAVLGLIAEGAMVVDSTPIATSFPRFSECFRQVGAAVG